MSVDLRQRQLLAQLISLALVRVDVDRLGEEKRFVGFITHTAEWSGHSYVSQRPRGSYVGILFPFEALFVIPGDAKPMKLKAEIMKQAALGQLKEDENIMPGPAEEKVYEAMATDAFEQFGNKFLVLLFAKEPKPAAP